MAVKGMHTLLGSLVVHLENNLVDPLSSSRVGSFVFGPDQEMNYGKYMPKIQVKDAGEEEPSSYSVGYNPQKDHQISAFIFFYSRKGDTYTENGIEYKNRPLVYLYLQKIEDSIRLGSFIGMNNPRFGAVDQVGYNANHQYYYGYKPITYMFRR